MKERLLELKYHLKEKWITLAILCPGLLVCIYFAYQGQISIAAAITAIPFLIIFFLSIFRYPTLFFVIVFTINYGIMGIGRYLTIPLPTSVLMDGCFLVLLFVYCIYLFGDKTVFKSEVMHGLKMFGLWHFMLC